MNAAHSLPTQAAAILKLLEAGHVITIREARKLCGCERLGARIWELKEAGHKIESRLIKVPGRHRRARIAEYFLPQAETKTA